MADYECSGGNIGCLAWVVLLCLLWIGCDIRDRLDAIEFSRERPATTRPQPEE